MNNLKILIPFLVISIFELVQRKLWERLKIWEINVRNLSTDNGHTNKILIFSPAVFLISFFFSFFSFVLCKVWAINSSGNVRLEFFHFFFFFFSKSEKCLTRLVTNARKNTHEMKLPLIKRVGSIPPINYRYVFQDAKRISFFFSNLKYDPR